MRFEIGPGGMFVILLGLAGLSCGVFGLGLIAGHELSGSEPGTQRVAAAFPLPSAPGAPAPAVPPAPNPAAAAAAAPSGAGGATNPASETTEPPAAAAAANPPAKPDLASGRLPDMPASPQPAGAAKHKKPASKTAVATRERPAAATDTSDEDLAPGDAVAPPPKAGAAAADSASTSTGDDDDDTAETTPPAPAPPVHKKVAALNNPPPANPQQPYSIQIDAVMDRQGARQMVQKLRAKGFEPYMVPTQVAGKTWYRLRVGHYATPEEAQAAEAKLHQEFSDTPAGH